MASCSSALTAYVVAMSRFLRIIAFFGALLLVAGCDRPPTENIVEPPNTDADGEERQVPVLTGAAADLDAALFDLGMGFDGYVGLAVHDVQSEQSVHFNGNELFPQQSVSKLWVALSAFDAVDQGDLELSERATVRFGDLTVFHQPIRARVLRDGSFSADYEEYIERALTQSDNTANDVILRRVGGPDHIREWLARKGIAPVRFGPGERLMQSAIAGLQWQQAYAVGPAFFDARDRVPADIRREAFDGYVADPIDGAAPVAIAKALGALARGELLSESSTARMLEILAETRSGPNRLKGGMPEGWSIAHKTGTGQVLGREQSGYNDVAILTAPDGQRYAVVVMIGRTAATVPARMDFMHEVVAAVVAYHAAETGNGGTGGDTAGHVGSGDGG